MIQNKVKIIGLTGGIGTGKSTVSKIIRDRGFPIIDADVIAREVVEIGEVAYLKIIETFGEQILNNDKSIDRKKLGNIVFCNPDSRLALNRIVHPQINKKIKDEILNYSKNNDIIFLDIPLLIEELENFNEAGIQFDEIWLVYSDIETQLKRIIERDNTDYESAIRRVEAQLPIDEKLRYANVIINNTGSIEELINNVVRELNMF
ncbi:dephospho-CoA kinase [Proteiniborus sp. MB09-C3]|uniref:dephospho-CoA kinase n=1 Tax=Proteiniborus sp. MB09-C3 TaxID=3050072 RepID=UPI002555993A|nr:dephospho-CoA kinase [Proteiniborus sp. MB09-C3]WIV10519.1 dephospho-CoA kinase [Proteiniborus sp. MB09-C3]